MELGCGGRERMLLARVNESSNLRASPSIYPLFRGGGDQENSLGQDARFLQNFKKNESLGCYESDGRSEGFVVSGLRRNLLKHFL